VRIDITDSCTGPRMRASNNPSAVEKAKAETLPLEQLGVVLFNLNEFVYLE